MKYLLDTNIFLRFLIKERMKDYEECSELFSRVRSLEIEAVTAGIVLAEISWVLGSYYKQKVGVITEKLQAIVKMKGLNVVDGYDWISAVGTYGDKKIKFVDAVLASLPKVSSKEWVVVSYDEDFKKLPVLWKRPGDLLKQVRKG